MSSSDVSNRKFRVGEPVVLSVSVYRPGTRTLMQVDRVTISSFTLRGADIQPPTTDFTLGSDLVYRVELDMISLEAGTYELSVSAIKDGKSGVILDDWFVLEPAL